MFEAMRLASLVSKVQGPDWQNWISTPEVLHAATVGKRPGAGFSATRWGASRRAARRTCFSSTAATST